MDRLLPDNSVESLNEYLDLGGGSGLLHARGTEPAAIIKEVRLAGLRGRGGAGFPTGLKWRGTAADAGPRAVVCNAAEGEPGTFKDRSLLLSNPYVVLEGVAIAARALSAATAYIGIKARFQEQIARLEQAAEEMSAAGLLTGFDLRLVPGPDDYLFGVETGMLEVIEGKDPLPRLVPPYVQGLTNPDGRPVATVVNNVETLAHVPGILARGAAWFRSRGTESSPGTMLFTVSGDVVSPEVAELDLGTPLLSLIDGVGGGLGQGRSVKLAVSGVSNVPLTVGELNTPLSFEAMEAIGSGLGAGGFLVYDDTTCVVEVGAVMSAFLQRGSCGQCPPCKLGTTAFASGFSRIMNGESSLDEVEEMTGWLSRVTDANRCGLGAGQRGLAFGILTKFADEVVACLEGRCPGHRGLSITA